jgi:hypothetical protein
MDTKRVYRMLHRGLPRSGKFAAVLAVIALVGAFGASVGAAGNQDPSSCTVSSATAQPFLPWHDQGSYFLAPGGSFESPLALNGWSTSGNVSIVNGNENYYVGSASDSQSMSIPAGGSATTPPICVSVHTPNLRLFVLNNGATSSRLQVSVNYTDKNGNAQTAPVAYLQGGSSWSLSPQVLFLNNIAPVVGGQGQTSVSFTFTSGGAWQIDDLYVDPIKSQDGNGFPGPPGWGCC